MLAQECFTVAGTKGGSRETGEPTPALRNLLHGRKHPMLCGFVDVDGSSASAYSLTVPADLSTRVREDVVASSMKRLRSR